MSVVSCQLLLGMGLVVGYESLNSVNEAWNFINEGWNSTLQSRLVRFNYRQAMH
ncbi:hypothetical protein [Calothrix sp. NIES-2100]|uniref:hypothetical protein n=1 Tax=Calothrix sp. NIES-2100 TaxID=1954172 RepID=UPI0030DA22DF